MSDEVRVRDQNPRGIFVCLENSDRFSRLDEQCLIIVEILERRNDRVISLPTSRRSPGSAVHDKIFWMLRNLLIEVVHEHAHGSFLLPPFTGNLITARSLNGLVRGGGNLSFNRHTA